MEYKDIFESIDKFKITGLGPKSLENIKKLGINSLFSLLYDFPRYYEDRTNLKKIDEVFDEEFVSIRGKVVRTQFLVTRTRKNLFKAYIYDGTAILEAVWFQMPYLKNSIKKDMEITLTGKVSKEARPKIVNPEYSFTISEAEILPVYSLCKGLAQSTRRKILRNALELANNFIEIIPETIVNKYNIMNRSEALKQIHFPENNNLLEKAKRRFAIEELLLLQFLILRRKFLLEHFKHRVYEIEDNRDLVKDYLKSLPFELTKAQKRVITEIHKEFSEGKIVNRLIQGDVGSGKSIVAFILMLYLVSNNYQCALMAPTEVLAEQHYLTIKDDFKNLDLRIEILTGSQKKKDKERILEDLKEGKIDILIGTHALIYDKVVFKNLGLTIIDEQHKFGVGQRKLLTEKSIISNLIAMSATPIPRSLALTIYGDLDVSIIDELPPGRKEVTTKVININRVEKMFEKVKEKLALKEQCYIVAPLIEDSEKLAAKSVEALHRELKEYFEGYEIGLMHGKLSSEDKQDIIGRFKNNEFPILLSTTVIEVGVNIPNASIMIIYNADRFGLSQLHQLRGRIGRGNKKSFCFLINSFERDCERLNILERTQDGFKIAEEDLRIRNAGEILGTKQSGISDLHFVDLLKDVKSVKLARDEAMKFLKDRDGKLSDKIEYEIEKRFENKSVMN